MIFYRFRLIHISYVINKYVFFYQHVLVKFYYYKKRSLIKVNEIIFFLIREKYFFSHNTEMPGVHNEII